MQSLFSRLLAPAKRKAEYFERKRWIFAVAAIVAFPLFYFIWHDLFPQPYENLPLRLLGSALFIPFVIDHFRPAQNRKALTIYWHLTLLFALPFFFLFMLFKNSGNAVWIESCLAALFIMIVLFNGLFLALLSVLGAALALLVYFSATGMPQIDANILVHVPIILFAVVMGAISNHVNEAIALEREHAAERLAEEQAQARRILAEAKERTALLSAGRVAQRVDNSLKDMQFSVGRLLRGVSFDQIEIIEHLEEQLNIARQMLGVLIENSPKQTI